MSIAIMSSTGSSPYDVGAAELRKARTAMKQLKELKVDKDTYKRAQDSKSAWNWNWITGDDAQKHKIDKQTKLEKEISKDLSSIAAANARNPDAVPKNVMKEARSIDSQLYDRLVTDYANAADAKTDSYAQDAYNAVSDQFHLDKALSGVKQDAIPLGETQSFIDRFRKDEQKLNDATSILDNPGMASKSKLEKARKDKASATDALGKQWAQMATQAGPWSAAEPGITDCKIWALPNGDPLKKPYESQDKALRDLQFETIMSPVNTFVL